MPPSPFKIPENFAPRLAVIGGGISGLAAAHHCKELAPHASLSLLEASDRLGGVLGTTARDGFLIERSADMFTTREPWALELCQRLGIAEDLLPTNDALRRAFVLHRGELLPVPEGFTLMSPTKIGAILQTPLLSWRGKLRLASEYLRRPKRDNADESLESFVVRRFGREAFERLIQPLVGGIYTADPAKLSLLATMPQFLRMEREHGSVIRGTLRQNRAAKNKETASGARYGQFVAPRGGMQMLVDALAASLPEDCVRLRAPVERLAPQMDGSWLVQVSGQPTEAYDGVVLAVKSPLAARLLMATSPALASDLAHIEYAGAALVILGVRKAHIARPIDGFGFVVPAIEQRRILAASFASNKFPGRAPEDGALLRVFVGGALQPELLQHSDDELRTLVCEELADLIGLAGAPMFCEVVRWPDAMPQYHVGHLQIVAAIDQRASHLPNFALAGHAYRGVGIPFCVRSGEQAARHVLEQLAARVADTVG
jgi:oxygen-dependent protoporphyrinogen oxidase